MRARVGRRAAVRGTARRVVIVPSPPGGPFEQVIFIVRPDNPAVSEAELLRQALDAAGAEAAAEAGPSRRLWPWLASLGSLAALGALAAALFL